MPDDTTAAIQALIQQVTALTETIQTQQKHIAALKADILDEKKDALRETDTALSSGDVPPLSFLVHHESPWC